MRFIELNHLNNQAGKSNIIILKICNNKKTGSDAACFTPDYPIAVG